MIGLSLANSHAIGNWILPMLCWLNHKNRVFDHKKKQTKTVKTHLYTTIQTEKHSKISINGWKKQKWKNIQRGEKATNNNPMVEG